MIRSCRMYYLTPLLFDLKVCNTFDRHKQEIDQMKF